MKPGAAYQHVTISNERWCLSLSKSVFEMLMNREETPKTSPKTFTPKTRKKRENRSFQTKNSLRNKSLSKLEGKSLSLIWVIIKTHNWLVLDHYYKTFSKWEKSKCRFDNRESWQMFLTINPTNWWTPRFDRGCILINLRKHYDAIFLYSGSLHLDVATICFGLVESSQQKMSMLRWNKTLIHVIGYDISHICVGGFTSP